MNDLASWDSCASFQLFHYFNTAKGNESISQSQYFIIYVNESRGQDTVSLCSDCFGQCRRVPLLDGVAGVLFVFHKLWSFYANINSYMLDWAAVVSIIFPLSIFKYLNSYNALKSVCYICISQNYFVKEAYNIFQFKPHCIW